MSTTIVVNPRFQSSRWRTLRISTFVAVGLSAVLPLVHAASISPYAQLNQRTGMGYYLVEGMALMSRLGKGPGTPPVGAWPCGAPPGSINRAPSHLVASYSSILPLPEGSHRSPRMGSVERDICIVWTCSAPPSGITGQRIVLLINYATMILRYNYLVSEASTYSN